MKFLEKNKAKLKKIQEEKKDKILVVCDNEDIEEDVNQWLSHIGRDSFSDILLEIGFNEGDIVYLYNNGRHNYEIYYLLNDDEENKKNKISLGYGGFKGKGAQITIQDGNKSITYERDVQNEFKIKSEKIKVSDFICYNRYYMLSSVLLMIDTKIDNNNYELKLNMYKSLDKDDTFRLDNEMELEKYLRNLSLPCDILDVLKNVCEISKIDLTKYNSFDLELCKKDIKYGREMGTEVISHIKFIHGEFNSLSYIKDNKKISYNLSGDWSYQMMDCDDLVKLSIEFKNGNINCNINSNNESELDDYFKDLLLYDMNKAKNEIDNVKRLVRKL